jgi:hypothetical protein
MNKIIYLLVHSFSVSADFDPHPGNLYFSVGMITRQAIALAFGSKYLPGTIKRQHDVRVDAFNYVNCVRGELSAAIEPINRNIKSWLI